MQWQSYNLCRPCFSIFIILNSHLLRVAGRKKRSQCIFSVSSSLVSHSCKFSFNFISVITTQFGWIVRCSATVAWSCISKMLNCSNSITFTRQTNSTKAGKVHSTRTKKMIKQKRREKNGTNKVLRYTSTLPIKLQKNLDFYYIRCGCGCGCGCANDEHS